MFWVCSISFFIFLAGCDFQEEDSEMHISLQEVYRGVIGIKCSCGRQGTKAGLGKGRSQAAMQSQEAPALKLGWPFGPSLRGGEEGVEKGEENEGAEDSCGEQDLKPCLEHAQ